VPGFDLNANKNVEMLDFQMRIVIINLMNRTALKGSHIMSLALSPSQTLSLRARPGVPASSQSVADSSGAENAASATSGCVNSTDLLRGQKAVEINHNGSTYRLQATRLGKLILTK
jgi:hemin uptake protein HemP